jgi:DNA-directed RNA polymerase specialized sigma24 family protein
VSLPNLNPTAPVDLEQLLPEVYEAVQWVCLRYRGRIRRDELDDFSQQIILKLFEDDCRRLHSFKRHSLPKTWLQRVADNHIVGAKNIRSGALVIAREVSAAAESLVSRETSSIYNRGASA